MAAQTKTATSTPFGVQLSTGSRTNLQHLITTTEYVKDGNNVSATNATNGSASKLWSEVSQTDYNKLPDSEKLTHAPPGSGNSKYYKLVGEYNTDGQRKWSTTQNTGADLANEMILYNDRKPSNLTNAVAASNKAVAKDAGVPEAGINNKLFNPTKPTAPAVDPAAPSSPDAVAPTPVNVDELNKIKSASGTNSAIKGLSKPLKYPEDLSIYQDKIKFDILEYKPRGLTTGKGFGGEGGEGAFALESRDSGRKGIATIFLPIPGGISDTNTASWGDNSMNAFQLVQANIAMEGITKGLTESVKVIQETANAASEGAGNNEGKQVLAAQFAALATQGEGNTLLSRTTGQVLNPNLELLFNGPELRSFNFTFKMSARNQSEADIIVKIIRIFKQSMSPQRSKAQLFVKAPNTFRIQYLHKNGPDHTRIGKIKECALLSMTTNYTPEGQYATYKDGTPISYEIQLQFKELEPVFNDEYSALGDSHIGY